MKALLLTPQGMIKEIEVGRKLCDLENAVHGAPMLAHQADDYIVIVSALSEPVPRNHNEIASALAEEAVYGRAVILGVRGETWCELSQFRKEKIQERKSRICQLKALTQRTKKRSKGSKPKAGSRKEKSSRR